LIRVTQKPNGPFNIFGGGRITASQPASQIAKIDKEAHRGEKIKVSFRAKPVPLTRLKNPQYRKSPTARIAKTPAKAQ